MAIFKPLYWLFGKAMEGLLTVFNNQYFLALIVFTVLTRLVLFPLNLRQQKTMAKTTRIQPKIQKIQKKYSNTNDPRDRQKMNEEMQALYQREGHNPMNMGCGPMAFQMIFLMGVIGIIYYPIQYILGAKAIGDAAVAQKIMDTILPIYQNIVGDADAKIAYFQLNIIEHFDDYREALVTTLPNVFTEQLCGKIDTYRSGLSLFGIDMTAIPNWKGVIILIPILCLLTSLASSLQSSFMQKKNNPAAGQQQTQMMLMMLMMPLFSFYISFKVPAAVGFYWIVSNLIALVQQLVMAKFFPPKKNMAREMIENTINRRSREESIKKIKG
ncbi:MAG: YidC/Oxa1 family membrane protein insertase [Eubacterium sp.]|nr:YidC/Oxa1 family membrane protein insertase [Eubacterium sp.]